MSLFTLSALTISIVNLIKTVYLANLVLHSNKNMTLFILSDQVPIAKLSSALLNNFL